MHGPKIAGGTPGWTRERRSSQSDSNIRGDARRASDFRDDWFTACRYPQREQGIFWIPRITLFDARVKSRSVEEADGDAVVRGSGLAQQIGRSRSAAGGGTPSDRSRSAGVG